MKKPIFWLPLVLFIVFIILAVLRLAGSNDDHIPSRLKGKAVPDIVLPAAFKGRATVRSNDMTQGTPRLLNIFASWCVPCIAETPVLLELKKRGIVIDAIAVRDQPEDIARFLARWGDPFRAIGLDKASQAQFALGSSGVPETFVIDGHGIIHHQHIGVIRPEDVPAILAAYEAAR